MTKTFQHITDSILSDWIGADNLNRVYNTSTGNLTNNYPPFNIVKVDKTNYLIEMAVSGFSSDEINIELEGDVITVKGAKKTANEREYLHKGISSRDFKRVFNLMENIQVKGADIENGVLSIFLEQIVPLEKQKRFIPIENKKSSLEKDDT